MVIEVARSNIMRKGVCERVVFEPTDSAEVEVPYSVLWP